MRRNIALVVAALILVFGAIWMFQGQRKLDLNSQFIILEADRLRTDPDEIIPILSDLSGQDLNQILNDTTIDLNQTLRYLIFANHSVQRGDYDQAIRLYDVVIGSGDNRYRETAAWNRALSLYFIGNEQEALHIFEQIAGSNSHPLQSEASLISKAISNSSD